MKTHVMMGAEMIAARSPVGAPAERSRASPRNRAESSRFGSARRSRGDERDGAGMLANAGFENSYGTRDVEDDLEDDFGGEWSGSDDDERRTPRTSRGAANSANFTGTLDGGGDGDGSGTSAAWALGDAIGARHAGGRAGAGTVYDAVVELAAPPGGAPRAAAGLRRNRRRGYIRGRCPRRWILAQIRADQHRAVSASAAFHPTPGYRRPGRRTETRVRGWGGVAGIRSFVAGAADPKDGNGQSAGGVSVMEEVDSQRDVRVTGCAPAEEGYRIVFELKVVCACGASTSRTLRRGSRSDEVEEADDLPQHLRLVTRVEEQI